MGDRSWAVSRRPPISLFTIVARTHMYTHVRRESLGFVYRKNHFLSPRAKANVTIRNCFIAVRRCRGGSPAVRVARPALSQPSYPNRNPAEPRTCMASVAAFIASFTAGSRSRSSASFCICAIALSLSSSAIALSFARAVSTCGVAETQATLVRKLGGGSQAVETSGWETYLLL